MKRNLYLTLCGLIAFCLTNKTNAQAITEGFEDITTLAGSGWVISDMSSPVGTTTWMQGNSGTFAAQGGGASSFAAANYNSTSGAGTISNWLMTPQRTFNNGDVITFYTRKYTFDDYADRLQVRFSGNGSSTNVGADATTVGDFTTLLQEINPNLLLGVYPTTWTQYTITISGLAGPTSGRIAFRYFVTNGGPSGLNSDYIGIDTFQYTPASLLAPNDNCSGAITVPVNTTCIPTAGDVANSTQSQAAATCSGSTGTADDDVWFKFVATQTNANVSVTGSAEFDAVVQVFSGTCGSLISLGCSDNTLDGETEQVLLSSLNIGSTYYVRVFDWYSGLPTTTTFSICVVSFVPCNLTVPANAIAETEVCGGDSNGGCNATVPAYVDITCGQTRSGRVYAESDTRDTDWYRFTLTTPATVTVTGYSEFPAQYFIVDNCTNLATLASAYGGSCTATTMTQNLSPGTYLLVVSIGDEQGAYFAGYPCSENMDYYFTYDLSTTLPVVSPAGPIALCPNASATLTSSLGQTYSWTGGSTGPSLVVNTPGSYSVTITDPNGCSVTSAPVQVTASEVPTATVTGAPQNGGCSEAAVSLGTNATAGSGTVTGYQWYYNGSPAASGGSATYSADQTGSYYVQVTNSNNCSASSAPVQLTIGALPTATITGDAAVCAPDAASLSVTATGGAGNVVGYHWNLNGEEIPNAQGTSYSASESGSYSVTVNNSLGCSNTSGAFDVAVNSVPVVSVSGDDTYCVGTTANLVANVTSAGTGAISSYQWFYNGEAIEGGDSQAITSIGEGSYSVVVTNSSDCSATSSSLDISELDAPTASFTYSDDNGTVSFTNASVNAQNSSWNFGDGSPVSDASNPVYAYQEDGIYDVVLTVTNACGTDTDTQELNIIIIGVDEVKNTAVITVYPNPASSAITVKYESHSGNLLNWSLVDVTGRTILGSAGVTANQLSSKMIDLSGVAKGNYTFVIVDGISTVKKNIVVQ